MTPTTTPDNIIIIPKCLPAIACGTILGFVINMHNLSFTVSVQILQRNHGDLIDKVVDELISMLQCAFSSENIEFGVVKCKNSDDIRCQEPLLIVCINASRLGSDAESAIKGINGKL